MDYLGSDVIGGRRSYSKYVWEEIAGEMAHPLEGVRAQVILGSDDLMLRVGWFDSEGERRGFWS